MAWMWWLLAPVVSTVIGATLLWWRARREIGAPGRVRDAMSEHRSMLAALPQPRADEPVPVTIRLLDAVAGDRAAWASDRAALAHE
ncbi:MAG: hypothetical protein M3Y89_13835 [Actinomycetota bacterium]|nr:hypothetical protein [Actinomycetota bacterium]